MTARRQCAWCGLGLLEDAARFEVRVAADLPRREEYAAGLYCGYPCWEAARVRKSVHDAMKTLHADAETVLSDEGKIFRRL